MKRGKNKTLSEVIKNEYTVPPLRSDLSASVSTKVFGEKKKQWLWSFDKWFWLVVIAVFVVLGFFVISYFGKVSATPLLTLLLIPAISYWMLSLKEIQIFRRRVMSRPEIA